MHGHARKSATLTSIQHTVERGGLETATSPFLYVLKMSLHRGWLIQKRSKHAPLRNGPLAPKIVLPI